MVFSKILEFLFIEKSKLIGKSYRDLKFFTELKRAKLKEINDIIIEGNISKSVEFEIMHPSYNQQIWMNLKASKSNLYTIL